MVNANLWQFLIRYKRSAYFLWYLDNNGALYKTETCKTETSQERIYEKSFTHITENTYNIFQTGYFVK
jgi:hypothetical protein